MHCAALVNVLCLFWSDVTKRQVAVKSTRGIALKGNHSLMVKVGGAGIPHGPGKGKSGKTGGGENAPRNTRQFFDGEESCYIIDAKLEGNLGRYLNVSPALDVRKSFPCCEILSGLFTLCFSLCFAA